MSEMHSHSPLGNWTAERVATLKTRWDDGASANQIAHELGGLTRNAVIGKVHRLGLHRRQRRAPARIGRPPRQSAAEASRVTARNTHALKRIVRRLNGTNYEVIEAGKVSIRGVVPMTSNDDSRIPLKQRRQLVELTDQTCHWPVGDVGDPGFFFCGGQTVEGHPYCPGHCRVAYHVPDSRPRSPYIHIGSRAA